MTAAKNLYDTLTADNENYRNGIEIKQYEQDMKKSDVLEFNSRFSKNFTKAEILKVLLNSIYILD